MIERMEHYRNAFEAYLHTTFAENVPQKSLLEAMRYSLLAGGKRIRPILVMEFCRVCGGKWEDALPAAAAIEMIHTYSLIHDDLPCMDNDDYRRGRLTNHKVYGEATAVLAGDSLLTAAFDFAADCPNAARAVKTLSRCAGVYGMAGGQQLDLEGEHKVCSAEEILEIHRLKTGALICGACQLGVLCASGSEAQLRAAEEYASGIGLAFQLRDDILDVTGDSAKLGKSTGTDINKNTLVKLYGLERCEELIKEQTERALGALDAFTDTDFLRSLAWMLANRDH